MWWHDSLVDAHIHCQQKSAMCLSQVGDQQGDEEKLWQKLQGLRLKRLLKTAAVVQDLADSLLALNDIRGAQYMSHIGHRQMRAMLCTCWIAWQAGCKWPSCRVIEGGSGHLLFMHHANVTCG